MPGVRKSRIGFQNGQEVVEVVYDTSQTRLEDLVGALKSQRSFYSFIAQSDAEYQLARKELGEAVVRASGPARFIASKHSLRSREPELYYLDLSESQAIRLNSWSYFGGEMPEVLTPEQEQRWQALKRKGLPTHLTPERSFPGLEAYRTALVQWLSRP